MGSFVTAVFLKPPGYVYAATTCCTLQGIGGSKPSAQPAQLSTCPSQTSNTQIRSSSSSLDSSELQCSNKLSSAGRKPLFPTSSFFFLEQKPCCPAAYKQFHGSLLTAASSACSTQDKTEVPLARAASEEGISCGSLCSQAERNKTREHLH